MHLKKEPRRSDIPIPPDQDLPSPVEEPPDRPQSDPPAPVKEPGPEPPTRLAPHRSYEIPLAFKCAAYFWSTSLIWDTNQFFRKFTT